LVSRHGGQVTPRIDPNVDILDQTPIVVGLGVPTSGATEADSLPGRRAPKKVLEHREPEIATATQLIFHPRVNTGFGPDEPFRKLLLAVYSEGRVCWSRRQVLAAFGYKRLGSTVIATIARSLSERGIRLGTALHRVGPDDAVLLERIDAHFAAAALAERLKKELTLLAAGRACLRYQDLLLFCGLSRDGPKARELIKAVLKAGSIAITPALDDAKQRDWVYVSIPVELPSAPPPPPRPPTKSHQEASRLADKHLARRSRAEDQSLKWRSKQKQLTTRFIEGRNTFGVLPCGTGKSLCFQITAEALQAEGLTIVVSPLIALITDMAKHPLPGVTALNSSVSDEDRETRLGYLSEGRYHLLYLTPEQLGSNRLLRLLTRPERPVVRAAIDEAHCVSEWGQSFRVEYLLLRDALTRLGRPPVLLLTATAPPEVRRDVVAQLGIEIDLGHGRDLILDYWRKDELVPGVTRVRGLPKKYRALRDFVGAQGLNTRGIIYTRFATAGDEDDRENVHEIGKWLATNGFGPVALYHGQLDSATKQEEQRRFTSGEARIAVATNAFGLGIDLPDIDWIVHFYMPPSLLDYYQEIGRGAHGSDGRSCRCLLLYDSDDRKVVEGLVLGNIASADKIFTRFRQLVEGRGRQHGLRGPHEVLYDSARKVLLLPFRPMKKQYTARIAHMLALESIGVLRHLPHNLFRGENVYAQFQVHREALTPGDMETLAKRQGSRRDRVVSRLDAMQAFCEARSNDDRWAILDEHFGS
jgi:RecQ family ATP-dependent DNA helicase